MGVDYRRDRFPGDYHGSRTYKGMVDPKNVIHR